MLLLLLSLIIGSAQAYTHDLYCDSYDCVIPYDDQGLQNGTEICYKDSDHKIKVKEVLWKNGKREGRASCFKDGKVTDQMEYKNDLQNGPYVDANYDSNGDRIYFLENEKEVGLSFSMKDGKVTSLAYCVINGQPDREAALSCPARDYGTYTAAVNLKIKEELEKNKQDKEKLAKRMNGPQESKYPSGKLRAKWTNKDGQIHGQYVGFYESGKTQTDCSYESGKQDGKCELYDDQDRLDAREIWTKGTLTKKEEFFDNGKISRSTEKTGANTSCVVDYYDSGVKFASYCLLHSTQYYYYGYGRYDYSNMDGDYKSWSETGALESQGAYKKGMHIGKWEYFDREGLSYEAFYQDGKLMKSVDYVRKSPQHRLVREYFEDGSLKNETRLEGLSGDKPKVI